MNSGLAGLGTLPAQAANGDLRRIDGSTPTLSVAWHRAKPFAEITLTRQPAASRHLSGPARHRPCSFRPAVSERLRRCPETGRRSGDAGLWRARMKQASSRELFG